jgi:hypothetical protein
MKTTFLIVCTGLALTGCSTERPRSATPVVVQASSPEPDLVVVQSTDSRRGERWRYGSWDTNPDKVSAQLQLDPMFPPAPLPGPEE